MLLRRVIEHVKTQNWTAVVLDFIIVVVGVFIGIQVSNWNDARQLKDQRAVAAERLHDEAVQIIEYFTRRIGYMDRANGARAEIIQGLLDGTWREIENLTPKTQALQVGLAPAAAPPRTTYDEIVRMGLFADIGDAELREAIAGYYADLNFLHGQIEYERTILTELGQWGGSGVDVVFDTSLRNDRELVYDLASLSEDEAYKKYLINGHGIQKSAAEFWRDTLVSAQEMCVEVARFTQRPCEAAEGVQ